jgi:GxxExxY protein
MHIQTFMNYGKPTDFEEEIGRAVVHAAYTIHRTLGPGLLERIYEVCMEHELKKVGFEVKKQVNIPI